MMRTRREVFSLLQGAIVIEWTDPIQGATEEEIDTFFRLVTKKIKEKISRPITEKADATPEKAAGETRQECDNIMVWSSPTGQRVE